MARFCFDIYDRQKFRDEAGIDLTDAEAAEAHALRMLTETVQWAGQDWQEVYVEVRDRHSCPILRIDIQVKIKRRRIGETVNDN